MTSAEKPSVLILMFLPQEWQDYVRRPHWKSVAERTPVLAVEPPVGLVTFWRCFKRLRQFVVQRGKIRASEGGLFLFRPFSLATFGVGFRINLLARIDRWLIGRQLRKALYQLDVAYDSVALFVVKVQQHYMADAVDSDLIAYEVTDECRVYTNHDAVDPTVSFVSCAIKREEELLGKADLVIASSVKLRESRAKGNANCHYLPNCADYEHFSKAAVAGEIPPVLSQIPAPRLGYVGGFNDLMDLDLLNALARSKPNASIVLIGEERGSESFRSSSAYGEFKLQPNVFFLGHRPYEGLPDFIRGLDVCLMPFNNNEWMRNASPNKTYQYLAAGKPVVSTDFPEVEPAAKVVYIAKDEESFVRLVDEAMGIDTVDQVEARQAVARANSTKVRAEAMLNILYETLERKKAEANES